MDSSPDGTPLQFDTAYSTAATSLVDGTQVTCSACHRALSECNSTSTANRSVSLAVANWSNTRRLHVSGAPSPAPPFSALLARSSAQSSITQ